MFLEQWIIPAAYAQDMASATGTTGQQSVSGIKELFTFIANNIGNWLMGIVILIVSWILAKMAASSIKKKIIEKRGDEIQESVLLLIERVTTIIILLIGATIAAAINGLNFTAVIGALSLGIGFALKDIIENFISGIIMLSQDRIRIGDLIQVGDITGTIISIDVRATILQSLDGTEVVIPNQAMINQTLISFSTNPFRRIDLVVGVDYSTDMAAATSLIRGVIEKDKDIVAKPEPMILVDAFGDSGIQIKIYFWVETGKAWLKIRSNLAHRIKKAFNAAGITIPFPIRTLKIDENDRALLKTMESFKKGVIPEIKKPLTREQLMGEALKTENEPEVPVSPFEKNTAEPEPEPIPVPATALPQTPKKDFGEAMVPPTHL